MRWQGLLLNDRIKRVSRITPQKRRLDRRTPNSWAKSAGGGAEGFDAGGKFEDLDVGWAVGPVVMPADDYVAAG